MDGVGGEVGDPKLASRNSSRRAPKKKWVALADARTDVAEAIRTAAADVRGCAAERRQRRNPRQRPTLPGKLPKTPRNPDAFPSASYEDLGGAAKFAYW